MKFLWCVNIFFAQIEEKNANASFGSENHKPIREITESGYADALRYCRHRVKLLGGLEMASLSAKGRAKLPR